MARRRGSLVGALLVVPLLSSPVPADRPAAARTTERLHLVESGETLSSISSRYFGNPHLWPALYRANRDQIKDPAQLYPGQTLSIPATPTTALPGGVAARPGPRADP